MRRTERLHALTEEIRRRAPAPVSAAWLADRLGVSRRTVERDLAALRSTGLPLQSAVGRRGGNALHPRAVLPPLNLTAGETTALLLSLTVTDGMPYSSAARSAANKLQALLPPATAIGVEHLRSRLRVQPAPPAATPRVLAVLEQAVTDHTAVRLRYTDRNDASTERTIEPAGFYDTPDGWALAAWCQLRDDARLFRLDRIHTATGTKQPCPPRDLDNVLGWLPAPTVTPS
ncbi:MAG: helix-turn-helix transcriptional regulator [Mycobacteriales bacterium]